MAATTSSVGCLCVSSTPTATGDSSLPGMWLNNSSRAARARIGPEPIAKNLPTLTCQPAYCEARQARTGSSVTTCTSGPPVSPRTYETSPRSARQTRAISNPAARLPVTAPPQSMTRAPATRDTATRSRSAFRSSSSATRFARSLSVMGCIPRRADRVPLHAIVAARGHSEGEEPLAKIVSTGHPASIIAPASGMSAKSGKPPGIELTGEIGSPTGRSRGTRCGAGRSRLLCRR